MRDYVFYYQKHQKGVEKLKQMKCGKGCMLRWDCVRYFIEDDINLHQKGRQNSYLVGREMDTEKYFDEHDMITPGIIVEVHRRPWYTRLEDPNGPRWEHVYYPPPVLAALRAAGASSLHP